MRNIIGQTKSGFNLREIMDNKKILLVNLSKGKTGELNSQLLGMIFVMKFQAAAMGRADTPEDQREDFALYVDEFQNFATDSFESILSEARKYRLNLLLANQFISQLTDKIREAIIGNVGTIVSGRIGMTDAELMQKKYTPVFDAEDLTKLPNYEGVVVAQINGVPSSPFSMAFLPPLGHSNPQLASALKRLSAAKYGRPRALVEKEIFKRLRSGDEAREAKKKEFEDRMKASSPSAESKSGSSFLDEWLAKRKQSPAGNKGSQNEVPVAPKPVPTSKEKVLVSETDTNVESVLAPAQAPVQSEAQQVNAGLQKLQSKGLDGNVEIKNYQTVEQGQQASQNDNFAVENAIQQTMQDTVMKQRDNDGSLQIARKKATRLAEPTEDAIDEIYIDLKGTIIHKDENETSA